ncbi:hypothetical protein [Clostridium sp. HV4-5-A1G]|uniref:hypothetical protein n=1 Tax=Clostridium sp. HV4-5-A1G TaxID=2004595 RepID=UPI00123A7BC0|nr:hypothetical protein [Clostridium sp. HV4-5-A1G]KAA8673373.1 hypothetical protein F3O63_08760 [Clostridium sp. HV4-5-A1G]
MIRCKEVFISGMSINFNGNINGDVIGSVKGDVNKNYNMIHKIDDSLIDLIYKMEQNNDTKDQAKILSSYIKEYNNSETQDKKKLSDKILDASNKLVTISKNYNVLYPIAIQIFDSLKHLI